MNLKSLGDLYRHMEWADSAVWTAVFASGEGKEDDRLKELLYHTHLVQQAFLRAWRDEASDDPYPTFTRIEEMLSWARSYYKEASEELSNLAQEEFGETLNVPWAEMVRDRLGRSPEQTTFGDTLLQVVLHTQYHRGQVNTRLRELGGDPPLVDYIAWVWFGKPAAQWPEA